MRRHRRSTGRDPGVELRRYFTLAEANVQVGSVRRSFDVIMQLRTQAKRLHERLDSAGYPADVDDDAQISISSADGTDMDDEPPPPTILRWAGMLRAVYASLHEEIAAIQATGGVIRNLEDGCVDWLAMHNGREIWLCWEYGTIEIGFWLDEHLDDGRRPLSELGDEA